MNFLYCSEPCTFVHGVEVCVGAGGSRRSWVCEEGPESTGRGLHEANMKVGRDTMEGCIQ